MSHDKFYGLCENKCLVEINTDSVGAAKTDLTNVDNTVFLEKAAEAGVGGGVVAIENGGTGATTAEEARNNLGVASSDLTNVENTVFLEKATEAGVGVSSSGGVGKDLTGQTVSIYYDAEAGQEVTGTAGTNAEIFNDYRERTYDSDPSYTSLTNIASTGNIASGDYSHAEGLATTASGDASHAEGWYTTAKSNGSHAEGRGATAIADGSHAEGSNTQAKGMFSHAEGGVTTASGLCSHAEGGNTEASAQNSHAEGYETTASGRASHAEGYETTASGGYGSHAEGYETEASGDESHAEGIRAKASGEASHAEGWDTAASGDYSHAEGYYTQAKGMYSHSGGLATIANDYQLVHGRWNKESAGPTSDSDTTGDLFIIGNGQNTLDNATANAFRVTTAGKVYGLQSYSSSGADYSEYFEWLDGNTENEDRRGYFVTLDGKKIKRVSDINEYVLGVVSATPSVEGDSQSEVWQGMYLTDVFGEKLTEVVEVEETTDENGKVTPAHTETRWILNPDYDSTKTYENRENRKEWSPVGLIGKLVAIDDGTCQVNGYCKPNKNGIATASDTGYRVIERLDGNHIRILLK